MSTFNDILNEALPNFLDDGGTTSLPIVVYDTIEVRKMMHKAHKMGLESKPKSKEQATLIVGTILSSGISKAGWRKLIIVDKEGIEEYPIAIPSDCSETISVGETIRITKGPFNDWIINTNIID